MDRTNKVLPRGVSSACGVYLLFRKKQLVYVGQSREPAKRIATHRRNGRQFDYALQVGCPPEDVGWIEAAMIAALNPPQNRRGVESPREEAPDDIVRLVIEERRPAPLYDPHVTMSSGKAVYEATRYGLRQAALEALKTGDLRSVPSNPSLPPGARGKRLVTRGDIDAWIAKARDVRSASGWRVSA